MSAWIVGLALSAGYLINKNLQVKDQLEQAAAKFNSAAKPATGGLTTQEIRDVSKDANYSVGKSGGRYDDFNPKGSRAQMEQVVSLQRNVAQQVQEYESAESVPEIQGVMLMRDNYGI